MHLTTATDTLPPDPQCKYMCRQAHFMCLPGGEVCLLAAVKCAVLMCGAILLSKTDHCWTSHLGVGREGLMGGHCLFRCERHLPPRDSLTAFTYYQPTFSKANYLSQFARTYFP